MDWTRVAVSVAVSVALSWRGYKKRSLSTSGAIAAFITGFIHTMAGYTFTMLLGAFFFTASWLTKYKSQEKAKIEEDFKEGGQRTAIQVIANSGLASAVALSYIWFVGADQAAIQFGCTMPMSTILLSALIGHYSCSNGDTWSSELGVLSSGNPILITTLRRVPKGTNGGVSALGMVASIIAGFVIGVAYFISSSLVLGSPSEWPIILVATIAAPLGSLIDSLLGATLQYSAFDPEQKKVVSKPGPARKHISGLDVLDNHQVNFLSILITMALTPLLTRNVYSILGLVAC